mgnify:CR=1 FL=1
MAERDCHSISLKLVAGILLLIAVQSTLSAQYDTLLTPGDTSYFQSGADDWNLLESVLRGAHANTLFLLKRGADPNARAEGGMTALMYAAERGDSLMAKLLVLNGAELELTYVEKSTPLLVAVLNQQFSVAHLLLQEGADPDHKDAYGGSPLIYAAALNDYPMADLLLFFGASDSIRDRDGNSALMTAVYFGNLATADVLLQNGLEVDARDRPRNTPLMIAAQLGRQEMASLLMEYGAGLEKVNRENYTPLAHAIRFRQDTVARMLIDSGANIHHLITPRRSLFDLAEEVNDQEMARLLKQRGALPAPGPDFSLLDIGYGHSFGGSDYMMQVRSALVDRKYGFFARTGVDFRPVLRTIQVSASDTVTYQYRENRWGWALGAGKYLQLAKDLQGTEYGFYAQVDGLLSFPRYRGIGENPPPNLTVIPSAGLYISGRWVGIKAGMERYTFGTLLERPWKMNLTLFVRIPNRKLDDVYKTIEY